MILKFLTPKIREKPHFRRFLVCLAHIFEITSFCSKIIFDQQLFSYCWDRFNYPGSIVYFVLFLISTKGRKIGGLKDCREGGNIKKGRFFERGVSTPPQGHYVQVNSFEFMIFLIEKSYMIYQQINIFNKHYKNINPQNVDLRLN